MHNFAFDVCAFLYPRNTYTHNLIFYYYDRKISVFYFSLLYLTKNKFDFNE